MLMMIFSQICGIEFADVYYRIIIIVLSTLLCYAAITRVAAGNHYLWIYVDDVSKICSEKAITLIIMAKLSWVSFRINHEVTSARVALADIDYAFADLF